MNTYTEYTRIMTAILNIFCEIFFLFIKYEGVLPLKKITRLKLKCVRKPKISNLHCYIGFDFIGHLQSNSYQQYQQLHRFNSNKNFTIQK